MGYPKITIVYDDGEYEQSLDLLLNSALFLIEVAVEEDGKKNIIFRRKESWEE